MNKVKSRNYFHGCQTKGTLVKRPGVRKAMSRKLSKIMRRLDKQEIVSQMS